MLVAKLSLRYTKAGLTTVLVASVGMLAACGGQQASTAPAGQGGSSATNGPVELVWAVPGNPQEVAVYKKIADDFTKANPDIKVKLDSDASDFTKVTTLIAGGKAPDVLFFTINNWPAVAGKNIVEPLDNYITQSNYDLTDFYAPIVKPYKYDGKAFGQGKLYGLPKEIAIRAMYYNADAFQAAGVKAPAPDKPWTWDEYLANLQKLTKKQGDRVSQYGLVPETWWGMWMIWAWSNGGEAVDNPWNPTKATLDDPKVIEALDYWSKLVTQYKVAPSADVTQELGKSEMFASGKAATYYNGRWMVPLFRDAKFAWDVMPFPQGKAGRAQLLTGSMFGISATSKHKDAAWKLLSYVVGKEGQTEMTKLGVLLPSRKSVAESSAFLKSVPPASSKIYLDELQYARVLPMHPKYPQMEKAVNDEVTLLLAGQKTAAEAAKAMNQKVNEILSSK
jgi:multiple sugar transport system substrate-binding protein